jgi:hypothetical protein
VEVESAVSSVLMQNETVKWSATAEYSFGRKAAPFGMMAFGGIFFGAAIWTAVDNYPRWYASWSNSPDYAGIAGTAGVIAMGLMAIWMAISKRAYIPQPEYRLTQNRTIIVEMRRTGDVETTARFIEPDRAVQSVQNKQSFTLFIPVRPEAGEKDAFVCFARLSKADHDGAIAVVNLGLGGRPS